MSQQYWYEAVDSGFKVGRITQLANTASSFVRDVLQLQPGNDVCLVSDTEVSPLVYYSLAGAVRAAGGTASILLMEPSLVPSAEPPRAIAAGIKACDFLIGCCSRSITHSDAVHEAYLHHGVKYVVM